jgi:hypothetical protein
VCIRRMIIKFFLWFKAVLKESSMKFIHKKNRNSFQCFVLNFSFFYFTHSFIYSFIHSFHRCFCS